MKTRLLPFILVLVLLVLVFVGCTLLPVSIEDRIALFLSDVNNANWSTIYLNFHPTLTQDYAAISSVDWALLFDTAYAPYSIVGLNTSDPRNVTGNMDSSNAAWGGPYAVAFRMAQYEEDWMIEEMDFDVYVPLIK